MFKFLPLLFLPLLFLTGCSTMIKTANITQMIAINQNPTLAPVNAVTGQYVALIRHIFIGSESSPYNHFN